MFSTHPLKLSEKNDDPPFKETFTVKPLKNRFFSVLLAFYN